MNVNKEDNLEQSNKSEVNPDQQGQETVTQATQHQVRFRTTQYTGTQYAHAPGTRKNQPNEETNANRSAKPTNCHKHHYPSTNHVKNRIGDVPPYQSLGNPRKDTLLRALKRHPDQFKTFPGLEWDLIKNHLPPSEATDKGLMIMTRKRLKSTRAIARQINKTRRDISNLSLS